MLTDTLRPNGSFSLGWTSPGANHHLEVDDPSWPTTSDDDTTKISEVGETYNVTDEYDLDAVTNMGALDVANDIKVSFRIWNNKASGDTNDFYVDIIIDGSPVGETPAFQGPTGSWFSRIDESAAAWQNNAYTQAQINSMRVRIRGDTAKQGRPHDITSKVTAIAIIVVSSSPPIPSGPPLGGLLLLGTGS